MFLTGTYFCYVTGKVFFSELKEVSSFFANFERSLFLVELFPGQGCVVLIDKYYWFTLVVLPFEFIPTALHCLDVDAPY